MLANSLCRMDRERQKAMNELFEANGHLELMLKEKVAAEKEAHRLGLQVGTRVHIEGKLQAVAIRNVTAVASLPPF